MIPQNQPLVSLKTNYLNGVYLHYVMREDLLRFVATDRHRLAMADVHAPQGAHNIRPAILSRAFVSGFARSQIA